MNSPRRFRSRRLHVLGVVVAFLMAGLAVLHETPSAPVVAAPAGAAPGYRFVSAPDLFNADIGNLKRRRQWDDYRRQWKQRFPNRKVPNSWNRHHRRSVDAIFGQLASERPDDALVAGDMVAGHWGFDRYYLGDRRVQTRAFGPTRTWHQKKRALDGAAHFYFKQYQRYFRSHGMRLWPAVGDHEYGDNPWSGDGSNRKFKRAMFPKIRYRFHQHFLRPRIREGSVSSRPYGPTRKTSYAAYLTDEVLLVTLDQFKRRNGRVVGKLNRKQLAWLDRTLARANRRGTDWIIVQGHLPIVPTVAIDHSSGMCYRGGTSSALWRTLARHEVDLYLNGEVHDNSRNTVDGVTQISHGGLYGKPHDHGNTAYLVGEITGNTLDITLKRFVVDQVTRKPHLFQTTRRTRVVKRKVNKPVPSVQGRLRVTKDRKILGASGALKEYRGDQECGFRDGQAHDNS